MGYYGIIWYIIPLFKKKKKNNMVCKPDSVPQFIKDVVINIE